MSIWMKSPVFEGLKWTAAKTLSARGYQWSVREVEGRKFGIWEKRKGRGKRTFLGIPGFGDSILSWMPLLLLLQSDLDEEYDRIVFLDFPGCMGFLSEETPIESSALLEQFLRPLFAELKPHTLMGHSLGGGISTVLAIDAGRSNQSFLKKLILLNPSGVYPDRAVEERLMERFRSANAGDTEGLRKILFKKEPVLFKYLEATYRRFMMSPQIRNFLNENQEAYRIQRGSVSEIKARIWLLWGEDDRLIPYSCLDAWMSEFEPIRTLAQAILIRGAGHTPQIEDPLTVFKVLKRVIHLNGRWPHSRAEKKYTVLY